MLEILNVKKSYKKGEEVLKGISLCVQEGDLFAFIGHNGAGKSTLIKCIAGILNFESGQIRVFGKDISKQSLEAKQCMAYVPDNPDIYPFMTGVDYISFILSCYGVSLQSVQQEMEAMAQAYEIYDALQSKVKEYSHGMRQKLVLLTAFLHHPKLLILDEPFVGLDPKAAKITRDYMHDFCKKGGIIFFSTHVLETAEKLCNKVAIIKDGEIISQGAMKDIVGNASLEDVFLEEDE